MGGGAFFSLFHVVVGDDGGVVGADRVVEVVGVGVDGSKMFKVVKRGVPLVLV